MGKLSMVLVAGSLFYGGTATQAAPMASAGYALHDSGTTNGGDSSSSSSFKLQGTLRNEEGGIGQGTLYALRGGVWQQTLTDPLYGDLNDDGVVDVADALRTLQIAVGLVTPTPLDWARGDIAPLVDGKPAHKGNIDVGDALVVLERAVGVLKW